MGQRADNYIHAWNGASLNWERVFGADFAAAPKDWVSVYRDCTLDELLRIGREGLSPLPEDARPSEFLAGMEALDRFRPPEMARRGVSRLKAIYALPAPPPPKLARGRERVVVEIKVDPAGCFVGDMDLITCLAPFIEERSGGWGKFRGAFRKYWDSVIPLVVFLRHYARVGTLDGAHWLLKPRAPRRLPRTYFLPEVLVMTPRISQRHIRVLRRQPGLDELGALAEENDEEPCDICG